MGSSQADLQSLADRYDALAAAPYRERVHHPKLDAAPPATDAGHSTGREGLAGAATALAGRWLGLLVNAAAAVPELLRAPFGGAFSGSVLTSKPPAGAATATATAAAALATAGTSIMPAPVPALAMPGFVAMALVAAAAAAVFVWTTDQAALVQAIVRPWLATTWSQPPQVASA